MADGGSDVRTAGGSGCAAGVGAIRKNELAGWCRSLDAGGGLHVEGADGGVAAPVRGDVETVRGGCGVVSVRRGARSGRDGLFVHPTSERFSDRLARMVVL